MLLTRQHPKHRPIREPEFIRRRETASRPTLPTMHAKKQRHAAVKGRVVFLLFHLEFNDKSVELPKRLPKEEMNRQTQQPAETRKRKNRPQLRRNRPVCSTRNS